MRFRFTIRDLLWLTALIAMGFGWWRSERSTRQEFDNLRNQIHTELNRANVDYYAPIPPNDYYSPK